MASSVIKQCSCSHEGQDKMYGKNMRVFNPTKDGFRCTVCGNTIKSGSATPAKK